MKNPLRNGELLNTLRKCALKHFTELCYECMYLLPRQFNNIDDDGFSTAFIKKIKSMNPKSEEFLQFKNRLMVRLASDFDLQSEIPSELMSILFSDNDTASIQETIKYVHNLHKPRNISMVYRHFILKEDSQWEITANYGRLSKFIFFVVFKADTKEYWHFEYPYSTKSDIAILSSLPDYIQEKIILMCFRDEKIAKSVEMSLLLKLKSLELDLDDVWGLDDYIFAHANKDVVLDSLFLASLRRIDLKKYVALEKPFAYEPSIPIQALIKLYNKEIITKELLADVWAYTLNQTGKLKKASFKVFSYIVNKELHEN